MFLRAFKNNLKCHSFQKLKSWLRIIQQTSAVYIGNTLHQSNSPLCQSCRKITKITKRRIWDLTWTQLLCVLTCLRTETITKINSDKRVFYDHIPNWTMNLKNFHSAMNRALKGKRQKCSVIFMVNIQRPQSLTWAKWNQKKHLHGYTSLQARQEVFKNQPSKNADRAGQELSCAGWHMFNGSRQIFMAKKGSKMALLIVKVTDPCLRSINVLSTFHC